MRRMLETDLAAADSLRRLAGWNQTPNDWARLLALEPDGCFVALQGAEVVGTVTTTTYGQTLGWIGMMLVHPERRRQGIATGLMHQALAYLQGRVRCIKLDATPAGYPLYAKLGFVDEWNLTRHQRPANSKPIVAGISPAPRALTHADWPAVNALDTAGFGTPRTALAHRYAQDSLCALVWLASGDVEGWGLLRPGTNADYLGPLVCASSEGSLALAEALVRAAGNRPVFWDIPDQNPAANSAAQRLGFAPVRPLTRMRLGPPVVRSEPQAQWAIVDPAVG